MTGRWTAKTMKKKKGTENWLGFSLKKVSGSYLKLVSGSLFENGVWCLAEKMMLD